MNKQSLMVEAIGEAIRELKEIPAGHLYAMLMGHMNHEEFEKIMTILTEGPKPLVKRDGFHLLTWIG